MVHRDSAVVLSGGGMVDDTSVEALGQVSLQLLAEGQKIYSKFTCALTKSHRTFESEDWMVLRIGLLT
jgi:hypothetical protein